MGFIPPTTIRPDTGPETKQESCVRSKSIPCILFFFSFGTFFGLVKKDFVDFGPRPRQGERFKFYTGKCVQT